MSISAQSRQILLKIAAAVLVLLGGWQLAKGYQTLLWDRWSAGDLNMRFQEIHLFWGVPIAAPEEMSLAVMKRWDQENYLPSSHVIGTIYVPPLSWPAARVYFGVINALAIAALGWAGVKYAKAFGVPYWIPVAAILACSNLRTTLAFGQYSIIVTAMLAWAVLMMTRGWQAAAILLLALATVKPVLCLPIFVALLMYRQWKLFFWASALVGGILILGFWSSADPVMEHLKNYRQQSLLSMTRGYGLNSVVAALGIPAAFSKFIGLGLVVAGFWALAHWRPRLLADRPLTFLTLAGFAGRAWFPAFGHDNMLLVPLMIALMAEAYQKPRWSAGLLAVAMGVSLWLPSRVMALGEVAVVQWIVWMAAVIFICYYCTESAGTEAGPAGRNRAAGGRDLEIEGTASEIR